MAVHGDDIFWEENGEREKEMLELLSSIINAGSGILYKPWCVPLILLAGGIILTVRSRFIQVRMFTESFKVIMEKPRTENGISSFGALMVSTASRVGTGNIIGVAAVRLLSWNPRWHRFIKRRIRTVPVTADLRSICGMR